MCGLLVTALLAFYRSRFACPAGTIALPVVQAVRLSWRLSQSIVALLVSVLQNLLSWLLTGTCAYRILIGFLTALWYSRAGSVGDNIGSPAFCQLPAVLRPDRV